MKPGAEMLEKFFAMSADLLSVTENGYFQMLNPAYERLGYKREEMLSKSILEFTHPDDLRATEDAGKNLGKGVPLYGFENRLRCKDGSYRWFSWTVMPHEGLRYAVGRDVTADREARMELLKARETADAALKELESITYSVSHDLRAPIRTIDGFSRALLEDHSDKLDGEGKTFLERLRVAAKKLNQLIDGLLSLSRFSRGELTRSEFDLSEAVLTIARRIQENEPQRQVAFIVPPGLIAHTDSRLMTAALDCLVQNAWKFTRHQAQATIELGQSPDGKDNGLLTFFIRDNGAGFDMANSGKLFGTFQRLHMEDEFEGLGIGLAVVRRIFSRLGGQVWAEAATGKGATFWFSLPVKT